MSSREPLDGLLVPVGVGLWDAVSLGAYTHEFEPVPYPLVPRTDLAEGTRRAVEAWLESRGWLPAGGSVSLGHARVEAEDLDTAGNGLLDTEMEMDIRGADGSGIAELLVFSLVASGGRVSLVRLVAG